MNRRQAVTAALLASTAVAVFSVATVQPGNESQRVIAGALAVIENDLPPKITTTTTSAITTTTTSTSTTTTTIPPTTTTTVASAPPPVVVKDTVVTPSGDCGGWLPSITSRWPTDQVSTACRVMLCESGGSPTVSNHGGSGASGLWQFMSGTWESTTGTPAPAANYSGDIQTAAAYKLWLSSGWSPWSCY